MTPTSPKLKACIKDVEKILAKYDVGGVVILMDGEEHSEYRLFLDGPSWSTIRFLKNKPGVHFKAYMKTKPHETQKTTNMLVLGMETTGNVFLMLTEVFKRMKSAIKIELGESTFTPHTEE